MSLSYDANILVDCSQIKSVSSSNKSWSNTIPEPIELNTGDNIAIYSAFINNKSSSDTIEITGDRIPAHYDDPLDNPNYPNRSEFDVTMILLLYLLIKDSIIM
jgi:hypothetical protein